MASPASLKGFAVVSLWRLAGGALYLSGLERNLAQNAQNAQNELALHFLSGITFQTWAKHTESQLI